MTSGDEGALPDRDPLVERIVTSSPVLTEVRRRLLEFLEHCLDF
jgi:hypothetical protein